MGKRSTAVAIEQTVLEDFCVESNVRGVYRSCCGVFGVFGGVVRASDRGVHAGGDLVFMGMVIYGRKNIGGCGRV